MHFLTSGINWVKERTGWNFIRVKMSYHTPDFMDVNSTVVSSDWMETIATCVCHYLLPNYCSYFSPVYVFIRSHFLMHNWNYPCTRGMCVVPSSGLVEKAHVCMLKNFWISKMKEAGCKYLVGPGPCQYHLYCLSMNQTLKALFWFRSIMNCSVVFPIGTTYGLRSLSQAEDAQQRVNAQPESEAESPLIV